MSTGKEKGIMIYTARKKTGATDDECISYWGHFFYETNYSFGR